MSYSLLLPHRHTNRPLALAVALLLAAPTPGLAQPSETTEEGRAEDKAAAKATTAKTATLPTVNVTAEAEQSADVGYVAPNSTAATKTDTSLLATPQSVSVVTRKQIAAQNATTLAETLRYTPGIQSETFGFEPRTTFLKMRGFDATETGLYQDSLKLANPGFVVGYSLEPYGAERIEVPRGPASVLYGQSSAGGLVNYISKHPQFDPFREIKFDACTYGRLQGAMDATGALDAQKTLAYRLTGVVRDSDTQVDYIQDKHIYVAPALTWKPNSQTTLTLLSHYQKDQTQPSQRLPAAGTLYGNPNGKIPTNRFTGEPTVDSYNREEFAVGYELEHRLNKAVTFRQKTRYYDNAVDDRTIYTTALLADQRTITRALYESFGKVQGVSLDNQAQFNFATGPVSHSLLAGLDFQHVHSTTVQTYGDAPNLDIYNPVYGSPVAVAPVFKNQAAVQNQIGLYLQDQLKLAEHWRLTLGGRYDLADSETQDRLSGQTTQQGNNAATGRAGLVYLADNGLAPYLSYAQSFLPVLGTDANGVAFTPETGEQYEVGVKFQPKQSNSFVTLAYFDLTRHSFLTPNPITFANVQRGEARSQGLELEGVASLDNGLDVTASYAYTDAHVTKSSFSAEVGETLEYTPEHKATLWADYTVPSGQAKGWGVGAGTRYIGTSVGNSYAARNTIEIPDVVLFDTAVHFNLKPFQFAVNLQNALDKEYVATAFTSGGDFATYGARRVIIGSVKYSF
jgi:iron complex outermembrane receptor protein